MALPKALDGVDLAEVVSFVPDLGRLFVAVAKDPRVPWYAKAAAAGSVAYVVSPFDVIPDVLPIVGRIDDVYLIVKALKFLLREAGIDVLQDLWPGTDEGFDVLLVAAGIRD